jgi:hypothetical protein
VAVVGTGGEVEAGAVVVYLEQQRTFLSRTVIIACAVAACSAFCSAPDEVRRPPRRPADSADTVGLDAGGEAASTAADNASARPRSISSGG